MSDDVNKMIFEINKRYALNTPEEEARVIKNSANKKDRKLEGGFFWFFFIMIACFVVGAVAKVIEHVVVPLMQKRRQEEQDARDAAAAQLQADRDANPVFQEKDKACKDLKGRAFRQCSMEQVFKNDDISSITTSDKILMRPLKALDEMPDAYQKFYQQIKDDPIFKFNLPNGGKLVEDDPYLTSYALDYVHSLYNLGIPPNPPDAMRDIVKEWAYNNKVWSYFFFQSYLTENDMRERYFEGKKDYESDDNKRKTMREFTEDNETVRNKGNIAFIFMDKYKNADENTKKILETEIYVNIPRTNLGLPRLRPEDLNSPEYKERAKLETLARYMIKNDKVDINLDDPELAWVKVEMGKDPNFIKKAQGILPEYQFFYTDMDFQKDYVSSTLMDKTKYEAQKAKLEKFISDNKQKIQASVDYVDDLNWSNKAKTALPWNATVHYVTGDTVTYSTTPLDDAMGFNPGYLETEEGRWWQEQIIGTTSGVDRVDTYQRLGYEPEYYVARGNSTGQRPANNPDYWTPISPHSQDEYNTIEAIFSDEGWTKAKKYNVGDFVLYKNNVYKKIAQTADDDATIYFPDKFPNIWELMDTRGLYLNKDEKEYLNQYKKYAEMTRVVDQSEPWDNTLIYRIGDLVYGPDGRYYERIKERAKPGPKPPDSEYWREADAGLEPMTEQDKEEAKKIDLEWDKALASEYNPKETYFKGDIVFVYDDNAYPRYYECLKDDVKGIEPTSNAEVWAGEAIKNQLEEDQKIRDTVKTWNPAVEDPIKEGNIYLYYDGKYYKAGPFFGSPQPAISTQAFSFWNPKPMFNFFVPEYRMSQDVGPDSELAKSQGENMWTVVDLDPQEVVDVNKLDILSRYKASKKYKKGDVVIDSDGYKYVVIEDPPKEGLEPYDNPTYFQYIDDATWEVQKNAILDYKQKLKKAELKDIRKQWMPSRYYKKGDMVKYNGKYFRAAVDANGRDQAPDKIQFWIPIDNYGKRIRAAKIMTDCETDINRKEIEEKQDLEDQKIIEKGEDVPPEIPEEKPIGAGRKKAVKKDGKEKLIKFIMRKHKLSKPEAVKYMKSQGL